MADAIRLLCLVSDETPPAAVQDLSASLAGQDVALQWSAVTADTAGLKEGISHYVVYRGENAYFEAQPSDSLAGIAETAFTDSGVTGLPGTDHYYIVRAVDLAGHKSAASETVGEFDRALGTAK